MINNTTTQPPPAYIDRQTRIIEFKAIGTGSTVNRLVNDVTYKEINFLFFRSFSVLNPTDKDYTYRWICEDNLDLTKQPSFVCRTIQGKIASGRGAIVSLSTIFFL